MWADAEGKEKSEIARVTAQASKKDKSVAEERARVTVRVRDNSTKSSVEEAATDIRDGAESDEVEREREEAEERD